MDGIAGIYLPDLKAWTPKRARRYLRMPGHPQVAAAALLSIRWADTFTCYGDDH